MLLAAVINDKQKAKAGGRPQKADVIAFGNSKMQKAFKSP